jgi:pimeloyl-ACP methyl ester carboxylesterase
MTAGSRPVLVCCAALVAVLAGCHTGPSGPGTSGSVSPSPAVASTGWSTRHLGVDGHQININCKGAGSPTIVFENGMGDNLATWFRTGIANAFPAVRSCVYDRLNTGTSDRDPGRHTGADSVHDLHTLLGVADVAPPYLLVGHSHGGLLAAMYAGTYPTDVAGLVLLDPTPPTLADALPALPAPQRADMIAADRRNPENLALFDTLHQAKALVPKIPNIAVTILASRDPTIPGPAMDILAKAMRDFTEALPRGEVRWVDSGHYIHHDQPQLVIDEIQRMLDGVR